MLNANFSKAIKTKFIGLKQTTTEENRCGRSMAADFSTNTTNTMIAKNQKEEEENEKKK